MEATIISTGEELVTGETQETNSAFLASELTSRGMHVRRLVTVGDQEAVMSAEVLRAAEDSDLVLVTGGLGPTADDRTRRAIARACGAELAVDEDSFQHVRRILQEHGHQMSEAHATQAHFPQGAQIIANPLGTARGFVCQVGQAMVVAMPGVPREMRVVFRQGVLPRLSVPNSERVVVQRVNLFGLAESAVDARLGKMMELGRNPAVGLKVEGGVVSVCLRARAATEKQAQELILRDVETVRQRFGDAVFGTGEETLAQALARLTLQREVKVAVAESCTGGLVGDLLTDVPGISRSLVVDLVAYSNEAKLSLLEVPADQIRNYGAVSEQVAESMAVGACRVSGAELGISTTGIAGPSGGTPRKPVGLVYVGVCWHGRSRAHRLHLRGDRRRVKERAALHALNYARLALLGHGGAEKAAPDET